jgi:xanthine dehydrogenase accessory factor
LERLNSTGHQTRRTPLVIRGAGELASGVAHKLVRCGFTVLLTEIEFPLALRRGVAFAEAIYRTNHIVEGIECRHVKSLAELEPEWEAGRVPVIIDPELKHSMPLLLLPQSVLIDARMLKTSVSESGETSVPTIGLGPGFTAPMNARFVVETNRGHHLGRLIERNSAEPDTGIPAEVNGAVQDRVLYPPQDGVFRARKKIGDRIKAGDMIGTVGEIPILTALDGIVRGILHDGIPVTPRIKVADIDPRGEPLNCFLISDKARTIAGAVLEAVLRIQAPR